MLRRSSYFCKGQTLVEYALIIAFVAVVAISVLLLLSRQLDSVFSRATTGLAQSSH